MRKMLRKFVGGVAFAFSLFRARFSRRPIPILVALHVTKSCDLRCEHCYADMPSLKEEGDFTLDGIIALIDELHSAGTRWIRVLGGEPLLRPDIGEIVRHIKEKGIICEIGTNGTQVSRKIDAIKAMDPDILCISLDGDRESNDRIRGEGSYDKALEAIRVARQNNLMVRIHATIVKQNLGCLEHIAQLSEKYGCVFNFNTYLLPKEREKAEFMLSHEDITDLFQRIKVLKKSHQGLMNSDQAIDYVLNWPKKDGDTIFDRDLPRIPKRSFVRCQGGRASFFLDADGSLYPCPRLWKKGVNLKCLSVREALSDFERPDCVACRSIGCTEPDLIMSLDPHALFNAFLVYFGKRAARVFGSQNTMGDDL